MADKAGPRTVTKTDAAIGARIRARRLEINMSQERLAELIGLSFQQVQKYEKGQNRIAVGTLLVIAEALDMPPTLLLLGEERDDKGREFNDLMRLFSSLNLQGRRMLLQHARAVASERSFRRTGRAGS